MLESRRTFVARAGAASMAFSGLRHLLAEAGAEPLSSLTGSPRLRSLPLLMDRQRLLDLPAGFSYQILSRRGERMHDGFLVPGKHDGMAAFSTTGGRTILVRNHELEPSDSHEGPFGSRNELFSRVNPDLIYDSGQGRKPMPGGCTTLIYRTDARRLEAHFLSLVGTVRNCSGGVTPWGTWITCEETDQRATGACQQDHGYAFEVPPSAVMQLHRPVPLKAMGRFRREAVAVDPRTGIVYQTEDRRDGLFYRFLPFVAGELYRGGRLQALKIRDQDRVDTRNWFRKSVVTGVKLPVEWVTIQEVESPKDDLREQGWTGRGAARFARAEGIWMGADALYFVCTNGGAGMWGQIWRYVPSPSEGTYAEANSPGSLELFLEPNNKQILKNADNLTLSPWGDLICCEDGVGENRILGITPQARVYQIARVPNHELAGATFSPDGTTLFANVQAMGATLAITGPWRLLGVSGS